MMRSLYSGVAGLKTHQTRMDVIGNNIANVNTTAYKSSSMTFSELMSQTTQKASGANATTGVGGTNAKQIGLGVKAGAINTAITTQGSAQSTGNPFRYHDHRRQLLRSQQRLREFLLPETALSM
mgnify:CR=1 FL=1